MPTKTDRILSYLPFTFLAARRQSALRAIAGAIGNELQLGENSLARIMRSHWVDSADEGAALIDDLERIASMYGLAAMRDDAGIQLETVEQFRRRLKRYVKSLLEGRVTVRGLLNVAAQMLDVTITEDNDLDVWWKRRAPDTVTTVPRGEDVAEVIFGVPFADVRGVNAQPAVVQGTADLSQGVNLEGRDVLRIQLDQDPPATIHLGDGAPDIRNVSLQHILDAINAAFPGAASGDGRFLRLRSAKSGAEGRVEFEEVDHDAALAVFGVPPHIYTGADATNAQVTSTVNLGGGVDLTRDRFLRVVVDGAQRAEIDCAGPAAGSTTLNDIRDAVNNALGIPAASHQSGKLSIKSPTVGSGGSVFLQEPAAQSATARILGTQATFFLGSDAQPAIAAGVRDLSAGVDLSQGSTVKVSIDGGPAITVNCAGAKPAETTVSEIVTKLNAALGQGTASAPEGRIVLSSGTAGSTGQIVFTPADKGDALQSIFGFGPRVFTGTPALAASFEGTADLSNPAAANFFARYKLGLRIDGGPLVEVDFRQKKGLTPQQIAKLIDEALGDDIAFSTAKTVGLTSTTTGHDSHIEIVPLEDELRRRFVTRAAILDEAANIVLGFPERSARGRLATSAEVTGAVDLQFGVDLSADKWVNISIDGGNPVTTNVTGPRPRTTTVDEIFVKLSDAKKLGADRVKRKGNFLSLVSTTTGSGSRIAFHPVDIQDAGKKLLGVPLGERRGQEAGRVVFIGTADLSKGVNLAADARVKIGVDAAAPVEVTLNNGAVTARKTLNEIVSAINGTIGATIASHDGRFLILASRERGAASRLVFQTAGGTDAAKTLFGFTPPRSYQADEATHAVITGAVDLLPQNNLTVSRFLKVSVDGRPEFVIDCAAGVNSDQVDKVTPEQIQAAIGNAFSTEADKTHGAQALVKLDGSRLVLSSSTPGAAGRIALGVFIGGDARKRIFGDVPDLTQGQNPVPAEITGEVSLRKPVNLKEHRKLLLDVDSGRPVEIDIAGEAPEETTAEEILAAINHVLPGSASLTEQGFLRLRTPSEGSGSTLEVLPRRYIELIEHPVFKQEFSTPPLHHGEVITVHNAGVGDSVARVEITSINGTVDPALVNHSVGIKIGLRGVLRPGEKILFEQDGNAVVTAILESPDGSRKAVDRSLLVIVNEQNKPSPGGLELPAETARGPSWSAWGHGSTKRVSVGSGSREVSARPWASSMFRGWTASIRLTKVSSLRSRCRKLPRRSRSGGMRSRAALSS